MAVATHRSAALDRATRGDGSSAIDGDSRAAPPTVTRPPAGASSGPARSRPGVRSGRDRVAPRALSSTTPFAHCHTERAFFAARQRPAASERRPYGSAPSSRGRKSGLARTANGARGREDPKNRSSRHAVVLRTGTPVSKISPRPRPIRGNGRGLEGTHESRKKREDSNPWSKRRAPSPTCESAKIQVQILSPRLISLVVPVVYGTGAVRIHDISKIALLYASVEQRDRVEQRCRR